MTLRRGDVVLVQFPFASGRGFKLRPALVVQSDRNNSWMKNTVIVQITTNLRRIREPTQLLINPATADGEPSGLLSPSAVSCENIATIEQMRIARTIGRLPSRVMRQVDACLKASLGL